MVSGSSIVEANEPLEDPRPVLDRYAVTVVIDAHLDQTELPWTRINDHPRSRVPVRVGDQVVDRSGEGRTVTAYEHGCG
jgi:hypothetical protein